MSTRNVFDSKVLGVALAIAAIPASLPMLGCDTGVFAAGTTIGVMLSAASPVSTPQTIQQSGHPIAAARSTGPVWALPGSARIL